VTRICMRMEFEFKYYAECAKKISPKWIEYFEALVTTFLSIFIHFKIHALNLLSIRILGFILGKFKKLS
jgi:hypothetical protein